MTFIASVIAKRGVALIADSLATSSAQVLEFDDFFKYVKQKTDEAGNGEIKLDSTEIVDLFKVRPSHTKDFHEKLFRYSKYKAVSIAGSATLNNKYLETIIEECRHKNLSEKKPQDIDTTVKQIEDHLQKEINDCLNKGNLVGATTLIITQYSDVDHSTSIHKVHIHRTNPDSLAIPGFKFITINKDSDFGSIVSEGQNRISERILWGNIFTIYEMIPKVAKKIFTDFGITTVPSDYVTKLATDVSVLPQDHFDDIKISKIRELSLQQAIDLASLLMRIERDIQKYTENIPTVGGNVKVAVIDDEGFRFISGDKLTVGTF